jgi:hypothetical protein
MKKTLLAGIAALFLATGAATAEVPTQYRGLWCWSKNTNAQHRCRKSGVDESSRSIGRDYIEVTEANENSCRVIAVKRTTKGHRVYVACSDGPVDVDLWFDAHGRLHNIERKQ